MKHIVIALALLITSLAAWAKPHTVTLDLPTMNCAMCEVTIGKALEQVQGVSRAEVSYDRKQAVVTYEDSETSVEELVEATTNAGYPSTVKE